MAEVNTLSIVYAGDPSTERSFAFERFLKSSFGSVQSIDRRKLSWQGRVGFGPEDYSMLDDLPFLRFDPAFKPPDEQYSAGGLCYVESSARWDLGRWPSRDHQFFDRSQPCR